ncbi:molybdopterin-dependent oxidoreductase [Halobellus marinus]|jgi:DMSO/TMAO reductase YedYZ molybdopterin-dependent catalytic subunit|uniref:molybdopterin-dependent oxidoreductase n=1 Tax=Halobellus TaxID=1073986 RepID=UPI0028A8E812|nr:molybdopterin-dependent oxidoreductase [Halobellus sp. DFY28]
MTALKPHGVPENVDSERWQLAITGAVTRELTFDRTDLEELPLETFTADFTCIEGWVAEDCSWRGVRVDVLLDRAEPTAAGSHALVHAMDGEYVCSFPLATLSNAVLAIELDGESLPAEHGGPARLVPTGDADCWESVKWVREIELVTSPQPDDDTAKTIALSRIE